jgi:ABC-type glycerol-3-phosphate transport system substrate-binding protein
MKKLLFLPLIILLFSLSGCGGILRNTIDKEVKDKMQPITLTYWRVFDEEDNFAELNAGYNAVHPNIQVEYRKFRYSEYEKELIEAFATDRGPDIFSIQSSWVREYQNKGLITPLPDQIFMVYPILHTGLKDEYEYVKRTVRSITPEQLRDHFVDAVYNDVVIPGPEEGSNVVRNRIWAMPLALDTMVMYYNKDLFNNAGISTASEYWDRKFQQDVKKLTKQNNKGEIIQSGVALGGSDNIERSVDLLSVLMLQNGAQMMTGNDVTFHTFPPEMRERSYNPGLDALRFYTDFANPAKEVYSWNSTLPNSLDMFIQGKLAMMFGYSYHLPTIQGKAPKLNFSVAPLPQIEGNPQTTNIANYWVETVSNKSKYSVEAWDFVQYMAKKDNVASYLEKTKKPTALRALVDEQSEDPTVGVFAKQVLTAKSWYEGNDAKAMEAIFKEMIDESNSGLVEINEAITQAARKVQQTVDE